MGFLISLLPSRPQRQRLQAPKNPGTRKGKSKRITDYIHDLYTRFIHYVGSDWVQKWWSAYRSSCSGASLLRADFDRVVHPSAMLEVER
jgi:hypothetical protein